MIIQTQSVKKTEFHQYNTGLLVIPVPGGESGFSENPYHEPVKQFIDCLIKLGDWHAESKHLLYINPPRIKASRVLLVNTNGDINRSLAIKISQSILAVAEQVNPCEVHLFVPPYLNNVEVLIQALSHNAYRFSDFKTQTSKPRINTLTLLVTNQELDESVRHINTLAVGMSLTRDLANLPGNICTPSYFAAQARELDQRYATITTDILDESQLTALGMGAYLAVGRGSAEPSCMPVIRYTGAEPEEPSVWVIGKGITFDTGGITLKKPPGMQNMIYDMCGGATVIGLMAAIAELKLPINVTGVIATAENMPDGDAFRPGDILTTLSGQTVEIISTDAEGRLVLCDAITYARQHHPALIIDIATLTGAQIVSLGTHASGLMGNSPTLNQALEQAGEESGDRAWTMPIWPDYHEALESPFADMRNAGSNSPGMITAGCYLARFAGDTPWAHLDIAGTSFQYGKGNSATGRPLPLLLQFLRNYSNLSAPTWSIDTDACGFLP